MKLNFLSKTLIILALVAASYMYAVWQKEQYAPQDENFQANLVLKELPTLGVYTLDSQKLLIGKSNIGAAGGVFVHIWGTWCAPCEKEMPEFLNYAEKVKAKGIKFYLIAINDDMNNVKKFMSKMPKPPENVIIAVDQDNAISDLFGTLKVPETFIFNSAGRHVNKFVGPQDWTQSIFLSGLDGWLASKI